MHKRLILLLSIPALVFAMTLASFVAAPTDSYAIDYPTSECLLNSDVEDTFYYYTCPKGYSKHNLKYNITYKLLTFKTSYKRVGRKKLSSWTAKNCDCGKGSVVKYQNVYHTW